MRTLTLSLVLIISAVILNNCRTKENKISQSRQEDIFKSAILELNNKNKDDINYIVDSIIYTDWETEQVYKVDYTKSLALLSGNKILITYDAESFMSGKPTSYVSLEKLDILPEDSILTINQFTGKQVLNLRGMAKSTEDNNSFQSIYGITYFDSEDKYSNICITLVLTESGKPHMEQLFCRTFKNNSK